MKDQLRRNAVLFSVLLFASVVRADEGMWLFDHPPTRQLEERYGFQLTDEWLDHVRLSCVRFGLHGSASIVSANGLVMTNHHVGSDQLLKLSTSERDLMKTGFYAASPELELRCPDLTVSVLQSIEDVTERVDAAASDQAKPAVANAAREKVIGEIEAECKRETGLVGEIVTLYHGARYHLYRYKNYTDVRLVMAPEQQVAFFGGDNDNFEYPRFNLDVSFFRIYEDGSPLQATHYLRWSKRGVSEGDLTLVAGHPYRTRRLYTVAHLEFLRDVSYPTILRRLWRREVQLSVFSGRSAEHRRMANGDLKGAQNSRKAFTGSLAGLIDPSLFQKRVDEEKLLKEAVAADQVWRKRWGRAWERLAAAQAAHAAIYERYTAMEGRRRVFRSDLLDIARTLVRMVVEKAKPDAERRERFREANLARLEQELYSTAPIEVPLEVHRLASGLSYFAETYGGRDRMTRVLLGGRGPVERARSLVKGTSLFDIGVRRQLAEGGTRTIELSSDPMIRLAVNLEVEVEALHRRYKNEVESVERLAYADISAAKFALHGDLIYPDATGSLRLAYGRAIGYREGDLDVPWQTTLAGLYQRRNERGGVPPFDLPARWLERKHRLELATPFNFITDVDVIGGNSGSPVLNRVGEVIGLVFDINLYALAWDTMYTGDRARTMAIDARAIIEALRKIYDAGTLADELVGIAR